MAFKKTLLQSLLCLSLLALNIGKSLAQQCTGYVLYKEDFGEGNASDGGPLPDGVTSYTYTTATPVEDGYYGIRKQVTGHKESWFQATDHTGNGYMMLINASYSPGLFYETRIDNLCPGSTFYFSAWVANLMMKSAAGPLDPNLKFVIRRASDSTVITSLETGALKRYNTLTWEECGINFSLPAGESSVILQIFNHSSGGNGNDLVLDDITFSICGPDIQMKQVGVYQATHDACVGDKITFDAAVDASFYNKPEYLWQFGTDTLHWQNINGADSPGFDLGAVRQDQTGWYRILVSEQGNINAEHCRIASSPVALNVKSPVKVAIATNSPVCEGSSLELNPSEEALAYQWKGPGGFTSEAPALTLNNASVAQQGTYTLTSTTSGGCQSTSTAHVAVQHNDLKLSLGNDTLLCEGTTITLHAENAGAVYQWNTGVQTPQLTIDTGGRYYVDVMKGVCKSSDSIEISRVLKPEVSLGNDTTICVGEPYTLDVAFPDVKDYLWQDGSSAPAYEVKHAGMYRATLTNVCGTATDILHVQTEECADQLLFPTAFTPNGDGMNDIFRPGLFLRITHYELSIFDRWGHQVFHSTDPGRGWNGNYKGKKQPYGTYIWMSRYVRDRDNRPMFQKGTITLIR